MRVEIAHHPAAAVQVHEQPEPVVSARTVQAGGNAAGVDVADLVNVDRRRAQVGSADFSRRLGRDLVDRRVAERLDGLEQGLGLWMERHGPSLALPVFSR